MIDWVDVDWSTDWLIIDWLIDWLMSDILSDVLRIFSLWVRMSDRDRRDRDDDWHFDESDVIQLMLSLLNIFEQIAIVILDSLNLIFDSFVRVFNINADRFHEILRHFSFAVVINSIFVRVAIVKQNFSRWFVQLSEMILDEQHEVCLYTNSQIIILDAENCILRDSISHIFVEYVMICFFEINVVAEKCLDIDRNFWVESRWIEIKWVLNDEIRLTVE